MALLFNVRVYGILIENSCILVADEKHHGRMVTKFPGGGLQFGEGTRECVEREFAEELGISIEVKDHFYTVDFFQPSAFDKNQQVISIYYLVSCPDAKKIQTIDHKTLQENVIDDYQKFRWVAINKLTTDEFTFPIDKKVAELIRLKIRDKTSLHS